MSRLAFAYTGEMLARRMFRIYGAVHEEVQSAINLAQSARVPDRKSGSLAKD
jgi:hypothetical protein